MKSTPVRRLYAAAAAALVLCAYEARVARAIVVGPGAFGPGAIVESFEGLVPGPNTRTTIRFEPFLEIGIAAPYTFPSGVTMTQPIPNNVPGAAVVVGDFARGAVQWGLANNGSIASASDVPFGTAYLGDAYTDGPIELLFPNELLRVGIYATTAPDQTITLAAYSTAGVFLGGANILSVPVSQWGTAFLGFESNGGIRRITLTATAAPDQEKVPVYDGLTFEYVPEPAAASLLAVGTLGAVAFGRRRGARDPSPAR